MYNFGTDLRKCVRVLYKDINITFVNNGHLSKLFNIGRGCRQGDCLSPYPFILCVEPLVAVLKNYDKVKGEDIGDYQYLLKQ